jgi:hypothetical protein
MDLIGVQNNCRCRKINVKLIPQSLPLKEDLMLKVEQFTSDDFARIIELWNYAMGADWPLTDRLLRQLWK